MTDLEKYADLVARVGVNVQKGQTVIVNAPLECADFARVLMKSLYAAGAREVVPRWSDERSGRITYDLAADATFDEFPDWSRRFNDDYAAMGASFVSISSSDPEIMKGVDPSRLSRKAKARQVALASYMERIMGNRNAWCVVSIPSPAWARKVFPGKSEADAMKALETAIYKATRVDQADPVKAWRDHQTALNARVEWLNRHKFAELRYKNAIGTDFRVKLVPGHVWCGGGDHCLSGFDFIPNMPTEEVFTMPAADGAEGKLVGSLPLVFQGNLIEGFWVRFEKGRVVEYGAKSGQETLKNLLDTDEGAKRLGEVALVPYDSPISNQRVLFYNTLFDENASCHFAFGKAYPACVAGGDALSKEQLAKAGANDSLLHEDFMIGTSDLEVTGVTADGKEIAVFRKGNFAI